MKSFPNSFTRHKSVSPQWMDSAKQLTNIAGDFVSGDWQSGAKSLFNMGLSMGSTAVNKDAISIRKDIEEALDLDTDNTIDETLNKDKLCISNTFIIPNSISTKEFYKAGTPTQTLNDISLHYNKLPFNVSEYRSIYENVFQIPSHILCAMNKYNYVYKESGRYEGKIIKGKEGEKDIDVFPTKAIAPSLFNPFYGVPVQGFGTGAIGPQYYTPLNVPIYIDGKKIDFDSYINVNPDAEISYVDNGKTAYIKSNDISSVYHAMSNTVDTSDCSIKKLVQLSQMDSTSAEFGSLGACVYKYADFMYCKDLGKVSNTHLITLRKFGTPIGDNIYSAGGRHIPSPDTGRLIAWFGTEDNKLEDICKFNYSASWKEINANEREDLHSKEPSDKLIPSILNVTHDNYMDHYYKGYVGSENRVLNYILGTRMSTGSYENDLHDTLYYRDPNKVYEPTDTTRKTHIYEGHLSFNQTITLKFSYKLRYYNGINPKSAFLDLLGNILEVTYKRGRFWGGGYRFLGPTPNKEGWRIVNQLTDKVAEYIEKGSAAGTDLAMDLFGCNDIEEVMGLFGNTLSSFGDFLGEAWDALKTGASEALDIAKEKASDPATRKKIANKVTKSLVGGLKNRIGRPAIYAMKTIYNGDPVGLWHLTVGNPRNPILSIGNLLLDNAEIQHSGPLGLDDFPTDICVTVTLKHGKDRDLTEIAQMYTKGMDGFYTELRGNKHGLTPYLGNDLGALNDVDGKIYSTQLSSEIVNALNKN